MPPIVQRADHVDALGLGLGVTEMEDSKAAIEITALWQWINKRMEEGNVEAAAVAYETLAQGAATLQRDNVTALQRDQVAALPPRRSYKRKVPLGAQRGG